MNTAKEGVHLSPAGPLPVVVTPRPGGRRAAPVGDRLNLDGLFEKTPEEQPSKLGVTPVEPEPELVEVPLESASRHSVPTALRWTPSYRYLRETKMNGNDREDDHGGA